MMSTYKTSTVHDTATELQPWRSRHEGREDSGFYPTTHRSARVLIVDDDVTACEALSSLLAAAGYETLTAKDGSEALSAIKRWAPHLILTDLAMPIMDGIELCRHVHALDPDLPVIIGTALEHSEAGEECLQAGAEDYLRKPLQFSAVKWSVERALERQASKREREQLRRRTDELCAELQTVNEHLVVSSLRVHELAQSEAQQRAELNALLEGLGEGIIIVEASGHVRMMNEAARSILGVVKATPTLEVFQTRDLHGAALCSDARPSVRALRGDDFVDYEVVCVLPSGQERRVLTTATSIKDAHGAVAMAIIVLRDVTRLRQLERQREEYTALISHDLRNPLNVIAISAQLLSESLSESASQRDAQYATRIAQNSSRMSAMLEELTEASRLESQGSELAHQPCDLRRLLREIVGRLDDASASRIVVEPQDGADCVVLGDSAQLDRSITNLITNALKYSGADTPVAIRLSANARRVELSVMDRGIGIAPSNVSHIFEQYFRTSSGKRHAEGLGLGLYIARLIVEAHGGQIEVASEVGFGSTFTVTLPRCAEHCPQTHGQWS